MTTPVTERRTTPRPQKSSLPSLLHYVAVLALIATMVSAWSIDFFPSELIAGFDDVLRLLERMLPPRLDDPGASASSPSRRC